MPPGTSPRPQPVVSAPTDPLRTAADPPDPAKPGVWTLGEPAFDGWLPHGSLDPATLHELKPATYADWPATLAFAACLAVRRRLSAHGGAHGGRTRLFPADLLFGSVPRSLLWCVPQAFVAEHGGLHGAGLAGLGLGPEELIAVEAARETDVLWALEEGIKSQALSLAIGVLGQVGLTPSRRLGLAAAAARTPVLLLTPPAGMAAPTAALRLRVRRRPSAPHPFDGQAPGVTRFGLTLERCRGGVPESEGFSLELEWCDDTHRFRMAAGLADRADAAANARHRAAG